jgi:hypothetical protein
MMIVWIVVLAAAAIAVAAGVGFSVMCTKLRDRHIRLTLGIADNVQGDLRDLRAKLAAQYVADTEMQINAAAPHLKPQHRRRLALALTRSRGLLQRRPQVSPTAQDPINSERA